MNKLNEQEIAVAEYLKSINVKYDAYYNGFNNKEEWESDRFNVLIGNESFTFNTGVGHRLKLQGFNRLLPKDKAYIKKLKELVFNSKSKSVITKINDKEAVILPTSASVLYCLLMDAQALETSFKYWCDDFGYNNDSLKALNTYNACTKIGEQLNKIFTRSQMEHLSKLLEDY